MYPKDPAKYQAARVSEEVWYCDRNGGNGQCYAESSGGFGPNGYPHPESDGKKYGYPHPDPDG
jgi:hypothetical protein